jgi:hypothetical protein
VPGQTAQLFFLASGETGLNSPLYRSGVKKRDAPVAPGKNSNRGKHHKQNKLHYYSPFFIGFYYTVN